MSEDDTALNDNRDDDDDDIVEDEYYDEVDDVDSRNGGVSRLTSYDSRSSDHAPSRYEEVTREFNTNTSEAFAILGLEILVLEIQVSRLGFSKDRCSALGIHPSFPILLKIKIECDATLSVQELYQKEYLDGDDNTRQRQFGLNILIRQLLSNFLVENRGGFVFETSPLTHIADLVGWHTALEVYLKFEKMQKDRASTTLQGFLERITESMSSDAHQLEGGKIEGNGHALSIKKRVEEIIAKTNPISKIFVHLVHSFQECQKFCITCSSPIDNFGVKPTVCCKPLCKFAFEDIGVGWDLATMIEVEPDVFDLLFSFLYASIAGGRIELHFPDNVHAKCTKTSNITFLNSDGTQNITLLRHVVDMVPSVDDMLSHLGNLREYLDSIHILIYPLLRWMITTNRSHLRALPSSVLSSSDLSCDKVFVLLTESIEKEKEFRQLRAETRDQYLHAAEFRKPKTVSDSAVTGSFFAYHGSSIGNWHSILRIGLKNYSNTKYMSAGAAYGKGVYFAEDMNVSLGYCRNAGQTWSKSRFGVKTCLALCEIVDRPSDFTHAGNGLSTNVYVVPQESYISTRYLLLNPTATALSDSQLKFKAAVISEHFRVCCV